MTKEERDITFFVAFCLEEYKTLKGMNGEDTLALFDEYGVIDYLAKCYDVLHTQSRQWIMEDIDEFIRIRKEKVS